MKIGFIGAGKVGCTLGRYFVMHGIEVLGYYDRDCEALKYAEELTGCSQYTSVSSIVRDSDILFITVTDGVISKVWEEVKLLDIKDKIICHCSGSLTSHVFSDISQYGAYGYSVHPLFACNSKEESYKDISKAIFTIEGNIERIEQVKGLLEKCGSNVQIISDSNKALYHCAAVVASNQVIGLIKMATDMLKSCGFDDEAANNALMPLITGNINNIEKYGLEKALTGPVERNDVSTIKRHLDVIDEEDMPVYKGISKKLVDIAKIKNPDNDYGELLEIIEAETKADC